MIYIVSQDYNDSCDGYGLPEAAFETRKEAEDYVTAQVAKYGKSFKYEITELAYMTKWACPS